MQNDNNVLSKKSRNGRDSKELRLKKYPDMHMKMSVLIKKTNESKSTILFYVKEGLLPSPQKPKPNLHLYHSSCIDRLKFIKLLQERFACSIEEIKKIMKKSRFDENSAVSRLINILHFELGDISDEQLFENDVLVKCSISPHEMQKMIDEGIILPINNKYTASDLELVMIYKKLSELNLDSGILKAYAEYSRKISDAEADFIIKVQELDLPDNEKEDLTYDLMYKIKKQMLRHYTLNALEKAIQ